MKLLVTGASGFIGRNVCREVADIGSWETIAVSRTCPKDLPAKVRFASVDLLDDQATRELIMRERPTHLLHLAWNATPGAFWSTPDNLNWVASSLLMLRAFHEAGGRRAVIAGTCAEYDWTEGALLREDGALRPATFYGTAKDSLRQLAFAAAHTLGFQIAWGRIFWLYGPDEAPKRLVSDIAAGIASNRPVPCTAGIQERDFLHVRDVAGAFVAALQSNWCGAFNIGSGEPTPVRDVANILGEVSGRHELIQLGARPTPPNEAPRLVADTRILREELGFRPKTSLRDGLSDTYAWWAKQKS